MGVRGFLFATAILSVAVLTACAPPHVAFHKDIIARSQRPHGKARMIAPGKFQYSGDVTMDTPGYQVSGSVKSVVPRRDFVMKRMPGNKESTIHVAP